MTNFLVHQKFLHIGSLIPTQLNDISYFGILLHGTVTAEILFEGLANAFHVQIIGQSSHCSNTFSSVTLLDTDVNLFFGRGTTALVSRVIKSVC